MDLFTGRPGDRLWWLGCILVSFVEGGWHCWWEWPDSLYIRNSTVKYSIDQNDYNKTKFKYIFSTNEKKKLAQKKNASNDPGI